MGRRVLTAILPGVSLPPYLSTISTAAVVSSTSFSWIQINKINKKMSRLASDSARGRVFRIRRNATTLQRSKAQIQLLKRWEVSRSAHQQRGQRPKIPFTASDKIDVLQIIKLMIPDGSSRKPSESQHIHSRPTHHRHKHKPSSLRSPFVSSRTVIRGVCVPT